MSRTSFATACAFAVALELCVGAAVDRVLVFKAGQTRSFARGRITRSDDQVCFSLRCREGQHMKVRVVPQGALLTGGHVTSPSGKSDGGPGGVVFDDMLHETGMYRICVEPREQSRSGAFRLEVTLTPPLS
jgi:hypothetical protein